MVNKVVGVSFDVDSGAVPTVVLKSAGNDADAVVRAGEQADVPVVRDAALVQALYRVPMDSPISRELFPVMAALIAHVLSVDGSSRGEGAK